MRGGKSLADRGIIPRLLSNIYRKGRKVEKDSAGARHAAVSMSYYEIYNDRVFDLFEPPEKRTPAGLAIRDWDGKTVVAGLTELPCETLKQFEGLYDKANLNRSTAGTKLNPHSSRSHAILCVKLTQTLEDRTISSTVSAIDLAGSEDNRRTDNGKERLVESSSINKSLFALAQCVEAIGRKAPRIPYRESKMTRILNLGQNSGITIMILNLAPTRSFHLDTLSTLNVANRTKKIEVREIENEPIFKGLSKVGAIISGQPVHRQPLKPIPSNNNIGFTTNTANVKEKPTKAFSVYAERSRLSNQTASRPPSIGSRRALPPKRSSDHNAPSVTRPSKISRSIAKPSASPNLSRSRIEEMINRTIDEKLAHKALQASPTRAGPALDAEVARRLEALENRIDSSEDTRAEGLQFLLMAKQHQVHGEDASALRMYRLALPHFPNNEKLVARVVALQERLQCAGERPASSSSANAIKSTAKRKAHLLEEDPADLDYEDELGGNTSDTHHRDCNDGSDRTPPQKQARVRPTHKKLKLQPLSPENTVFPPAGQSTPRTTHLLAILNTRDTNQIRGLRGVGQKKAEAIVSAVCELDEEDLTSDDLGRLGECRGVGVKSLEGMRRGLGV